MHGFLELVLTAPDSSLLYIGEYDPLLVAFSVLAAMFAAYTALLVSQRINLTEQAWQRRLWIAAGGIAMGAGIWAMHFVGMLAFSLPCTTTYDPIITLISMIPGVLASTLAIALISRPALSRQQLGIGGLLLGAGIGSMHYMGMAAYRMDGFIRYNTILFAISILVAVGLATLALWIKFRLRSGLRSWHSAPLLLSAAVMGLAVSGMHYTAMASAYFVRDDSASTVTTSMAPSFLAAIVLAVTATIIVITLVATYFTRSSKASLRSNFLPVGGLMAGWTVIAWLAAGYYTHSQQTRVLAQEAIVAQQQLSALSSSIDDSLQILRGIPKLLTKDAALQRALLPFAPGAPASVLDYEKRKSIWSKDPQLAKINELFLAAADTMNIDAVWLLNEAGDCIASSNVDSPSSFVGTNYADRLYFREARQGHTGQQYAVGRKTGIPGIYYSYPVWLMDRFAGAVVVKRDITDFTHWTRNTNAFIADANGVIVLADDKSLEFRTLAGANLHKMPDAERQAQYQRTEFKPLGISPWKNNHFPGLFRLGDAPEPVILPNQPTGENGLTVHLPHAIPEITRIQNQKTGMFLLIALAGCMAIMAVASIMLYMISLRREKEDSELNSRQLEALVDKRTEELREARDTAERASLAKSAFLANMSHEIRTPMNAILGMATLLKREGLNPKQADRLKTMDGAARHLLSIIDNILDISKIEAGKLTLEEIDLQIDTIPANVVSILTERAQAKGLQLKVENAIQRRHLRGDPTRLTQALLNFATNAIKFTESGSVILSLIQEDENEAGTLIRFEVRDTGAGITEEAQGRLFKAFEQADNSITRSHGGTGLGLAITKRLVELMGGSVGIASTPGVGSTFWFSVRLKPARAIKSQPPTEQALPAHEILRRDFPDIPVLLVEDNMINREVALEMLGLTGCHIDTAEDGLEALQKVEQKDYALILMDMQMPRMDGLEATRRIRQLAGKARMPIVAMTANAFTEDRQRCLEAGMDEFVIKPVDPDILFSTMLACLQKAA